MYSFLIGIAVILAQPESTKPKLETADDKARFERWQKYYRRVAAEYTMEEGNDPPSRLKLRPEPVLSYANPAGGSRSHGAMFVWTREGRPEILGSIWSREEAGRRQVIHEMHSLALEPLTATRNGKLFWSPRGPGIEPFLIPGAPKPAPTPALRMIQMRGLTREFSGSTIREAGERPLQFRSQPVFRFEKPSAERDGAVFVGFEDWDPELLLLIEVRPTANGPRWHAGFARFTNRPASARHKGTEVWRFNESSPEGPMGGFDKRFYCTPSGDVLPIAGPD